MKEEITYEQAKAAKEVLIKYLKKELDSYEPVCSPHYGRYKEALVYLALTQDNFLD